MMLFDLLGSNLISYQVVIQTLSSLFCVMLHDIWSLPAPYYNLLFLKLVHVTCIAHLMHNCAIKVKAQFHNIDQVIAKVKGAHVECKTIQPVMEF